MASQSKRWKVTGVDNDSGHETSIVFQATSAAVAKVMAERKGVHVAEVIDIEHEEFAAIRRELSGRLPDEPETPARRSPRPGEIICPNANCGYIGPPKKVARGSALVFLLLALLLLVPAIIYAIFMRGYRYSCPRCGVQIGADL